MFSDLKMSWLVDLAGRAEDFLNKVDQGAASALTKPTIQSSSASYDLSDPNLNDSSYNPQQSYTSREMIGYISSAAENIKKSKVSVLAGTSNVASTSALGSGSSASSAGAAKTSSNFVRPQKNEVDDDMLFDFLNSSDPPLIEKREIIRAMAPFVMNTVDGSSQGQVSIPAAPATPPSTRALSRTSSVSSLTASTHSAKTDDGFSRDIKGIKITTYCYSNVFFFYTGQFGNSFVPSR